MRLGPSHKSKVLAYIAPKTIVAAAGECDPKWCQINFKNMTGWVFRSYLEETNDPLTVVAQGQPAEQQQKPDNPPEKASSFYAAPKNASVALQVQEFPGAGMPVVGVIPPTATGIQNLGRCVQQWCRVRHQQVEGWVLLDELKSEEKVADAASDDAVKDVSDAGSLQDDEPKSEQAARVSVIRQASLSPASVLSEARPPIAKPSAQAPPGEAIKYNVVGLSASSWLHLREKPVETAKVIGSIAPNAVGIEDMRECMRQWCLVRYGASTGFVQRRFLARQREQDSDRYRVDGVPLDESLKVFDFPGSDAQIVGSIPTYASGIVPIGDCSPEWCHIRYLGLVGWVATPNLAAEVAPRS